MSKSDHNIPKDFDSTIKHEKKPAASVGVVSGGHDARVLSKLHIVRPNIKRILPIAAILLIATVAVVALSQRNSSNKANDLSGTQSTQVANVDPNLTEEQKASQQLANDYEKQTPTLVKQTKSGNDTQKSEAYADLANLALQNNKPDDALKYALQGEDVAKSAYSASIVAIVYEQQKNYAKAAEYYGLAMERSEKPASPTTNSPYNDYRIKKSEMEQLR